MSLALPLGLLGLLGIAALILIYILKPKYAEKAVSSTFVWKLTLKYKKKKLPFQWLRSSLLLILQLSILSLLAFSLAQPLFAVSIESGEKIIILESSASMLAQKDGRTRFDRALTDITRLAEETVPKDKVSVILAAGTAVPLVTRSDAEGLIKLSLTGVECGYGQADIPGAMTLAESILRENPSAEIILYTCREHPDSGVTVKNMSDREWNAAILDFKAEFIEGYFRFSVETASYNTAADLSLVLEIDGQFAEVKAVRLGADQPQTVAFGAAPVSYDNARVYIDVADAFVYDNEFRLFGGGKQNFRIQLVSKAPLFLGAALRADRNCDVIVPGYTPEAAELIQAAANEAERLMLIDGFTIDDYLYESAGYDLYVYERMTPGVLPVDGAVWLINPESEPSGSGLSLGARVSGSFTLTATGAGGEAYDAVFANNFPYADVTLSDYRRVLRADGYEEIFTVGGNPVLLARQADGVKLTVFALDFHNTNLPITLGFPILINNLIQYSLTRTTESYLYEVGNRVAITPAAVATSITVEGGGIRQDFDAVNEKVSVTVNKSGAYTVTQTLRTKSTEENFFVRIAKGQSDFSSVGEAVKLPPVSGTAPKVFDTIDILSYLALALLAIISFEWERQYREQY